MPAGEALAHQLVFSSIEFEGLRARGAAKRLARGRRAAPTSTGIAFHTHLMFSMAVSCNSPSSAPSGADLLIDLDSARHTSGVRSSFNKHRMALPSFRIAERHTFGVRSLLLRYSIAKLAPWRGTPHTSGVRCSSQRNSTARPLLCTAARHTSGVRCSGERCSTAQPSCRTAARQIQLFVFWRVEERTLPNGVDSWMARKSGCRGIQCYSGLCCSAL